MFRFDSSDWSNGIRYHTFGTRPDTEFKECAAVVSGLGEHQSRGAAVGQSGPRTAVERGHRARRRQTVGGTLQAYT